MHEDSAAQAGSLPCADADAALAQRLERCDPNACAELYDRFALGIHRFAATWLSADVMSADDVVVETMADAVRNIKRFDPRRASLAAWLYGIARRRVQVALRWHMRRKSVPPAARVSMETIAEAPDSTDLAEAVADRLDATRRLGRLLERLSETEREVLVLACVERLSMREVAQVVRRSERAVHSILYRAKRKARERLEHNE
jgi:RNA polymerase sigma-70 factor (ECF subfamily)